MGSWSIIWDLTYACPLRCEFCYSESGRRSSRTLRGESLERLIDRIIDERISYISLAGGEAIIHPDFRQIVDRLRNAGIGLHLFTSGLISEPATAEWLLSRGVKVSVSLESADAPLHNKLRGRDNAFQNAITALRLMDAASNELKKRGEKPAEFGIDSTLLRTNLHQVADLIELAGTFSNVAFLNFSPGVPSGVASKNGYAEDELLTFEHIDEFNSPEFQQKWQARSQVPVEWFDPRSFRMGPGDAGRDRRFFHLEPDGKVRAFTMYEGVVADMLEDSLEEIQAKVFERRHDPWVTAQLESANTMAKWAAAVRTIDQRYVPDRDRRRIFARAGLSIA